MTAKQDVFYEIWEDTATIRDLAKALVITVGLTMTAYLLAPDEPPLPLVAGLGGAVVGFIICAIIIPTKRSLSAVEMDERRPQDDGWGER